MNKNITALILIIIAIGIYFTYTQGVINDVKAVKAVNEQYAAALAGADKLLLVRDKTRDAYNNISQVDRQNLSKMLPSTVDNILLIIMLNNIALQHGFSLKDIKAAASDNTLAASAPVAPAGGLVADVGSLPTIATPTLDTIKVSFNVTAPYNQFVGFLQDIEANLRIMDVTHLTVTPSDTGVYDFDVELNTYWLRQ